MPSLINVKPHKFLVCISALSHPELSQYLLFFEEQQLRHFQRRGSGTEDVLWVLTAWGAQSWGTLWKLLWKDP